MVVGRDLKWVRFEFLGVFVVSVRVVSGCSFWVLGRGFYVDFGSVR